jgi:hypothetical protein
MLGRLHAKVRLLRVPVRARRPDQSNLPMKQSKPLCRASSITLLLLLAAATGLCATGRAIASDVRVYSPADRVAGRSQSELSVLWWQWAASFDRETSPVADRTGEHCGRRQPDGIWFLAGTYGTARTIRTCRVPAGRPLFFPLANHVLYPRPGRSANCPKLISDAAEITDAPSALVLELDGTRIDVDHSSRQAPRECFDLSARIDPPVSELPAAANGYYIALRPLPRGTHQLNFGAILPAIKQAVTYTLIVE